MTETTASTAAPRVDYRIEPSQYRHWSIGFDGEIARLTLDIAEDGGIRPGSVSYTHLTLPTKA